jgi:hypothetical protein
MISNAVRIGIATIQDELEGQDGTLEGTLVLAMQKAKNLWCCPNPDEQFRAATGAVMLHYGEGSEQFKRLVWEMGQINLLSAFLEARDRGLKVEIPEPDDTYEPIGLLGMWAKLNE